MSEFIQSLTLKEKMKTVYGFTSGDREKLLHSFLEKGDRIHLASPEWMPFPDLFVLSHPEDVTRLWEGEQDSLDKEGFIYNLIRRHAGTGLFTMPGGDVWKSHQRRMGHSLVRINREDMQDQVRSSLDEGFQHAELGLVEDSVLLHPHRFIKAVSMQVNAAAVLHARLSFSQASELADAFTIIHDFTDTNVRRLWIPEMIDKATPIFQSKLHCAEETVDFYASSIKSQPIIQGSLLDTLTQRNGENGTLTDQEVKDEIVTILAAGHGTIATAVTNALHLLAIEKHADIQQQIYTELQDSSGVHRSPLLAASFREAIRLYPPVYITVRRVEKAIEYDLERGSMRIPSGSVIALSPYLTHRHPDFWSDAEEFIPERFLDENKISRNAYIPFGAGRRRCIGEHLAGYLGSEIMSSILNDFTISANQEVRPQFAATIRPTKNLIFELQRR